jgi:GGDEF domain-containing protein
MSVRPGCGLAQRIWWSVSGEDRRGLRIAYVALWAVIAVAAGVVVWAVPAAVRFAGAAPSTFWALALAALLVDVPLFGLTDRNDWRLRTTLSVGFTFAIFVLWGAGPAIVVQVLAGAVTSAGQRYDPRAGLFLISRVVLGIAVAGLVAVLGGLRPITEEGHGLSGRELLTIMLLAVVWGAVNYGVMIGARSTVRPAGLRQAAADARGDLVATAVVVLAVVPLLTVIAGWWTLLVAAALMVWNLLRREQQSRELRMGRDPESGLLNRQGLASGMRAITSRDFVAPYGPRPFGLIVVNVESVLEINRTLGRELYEKVVGVASRRLADAYGEDRTARLTAEGIVIFVPDLTEENAVDATRQAVALLEPRIEVDDIPFTLDPVGGVALSPQHGRDLGSLLMKAELAAGEARHQHRRAAVYVHRTAEQGQRRVTLLRELHAVLRDPARHHEIEVLYQPQVEIGTGQLMAVEALLRWTRPPPTS